MADEYESLTVKALKEEAAKREGLTIKSGLRKADIIEKLREWDAKQTAPAADKADNQAPEEDDSGAKHAVDDPPESMPPATEEVKPPPDVKPATEERAAVAEPENEPTPPADPESIQPVVTEAELDPIQDASAPATEEAQPLASPVPTSLEGQSSTGPVQDSAMSSDTQLPASDIAEDSRKRKRRSATPAVDADKVEAKRARIAEVADQDVAFEDAPPAVQDAPPAVQDTPSAVQDAPNPETSRPESLRRDMRSMFNQNGTKPDEDTKSEEDYDLHIEHPDVEQSQHSHTRAIYISNLKRPLQQAALQKELNRLGASGSDEEEPLEHIYLDTIKTHAFALFTSKAAASRARASLHNVKFPKEASREPLFVDFVPHSKVNDWIEKEKNNGGSVRWHVVYTPTGDAVHEAIGPGSNPRNVRPTPTGPRGSYSAPSPAPPSVRPSGPNASPLAPRQKAAFGKLEDLFDKTHAKPTIYYKTAPAALADARLKELSYQTSRDWREESRRENEEIWRYSFDGQTDRFVTSGPQRTNPKIRDREIRLEREARDGARRDWRQGDNYRKEMGARERRANRVERFEEERRERFEREREREDLDMDR